MNKVNNYYVTWDEYSKTVIQLARTIKSSGWQFDQIVAIARGGMFVGDPLTRIFKKPIAVTVASSYRGKERKEMLLSKEVAMSTDTIGKRILLVDDLVDSGESLIAMTKFLKEKYSHIEEIRTAVLWKKSGTNFNPDYYADEVDEQTWIHQPFEQFDEGVL